MPANWWFFLVVLFLLGLLFQIYPLTVFAIVLAALVSLAYWWQKHAFDGLIYLRRPFYRRGFPGERVPLRLEVENRKFLPLSWLRIDDPWPMLVAPEDENQIVPSHNPDFGTLINLFSLRWYERSRRTYTLLLRQRGIYRLGPQKVETGDLFGLFERTTEDGHYDYLTVFPEPIPFEELRLPSEDPFGDRHGRKRLYEDPNQPMGVRDYRPEDDFRHIHWPATAHTGELQVKVYQPATARVMVACLNTSTLRYYWQGVYPTLLEHLVRVTATVVMRGLEDGYRVGLISNGALAHSDQPFRIPPGRSPDQLGYLLTALAGVTPFAGSSFEQMLITEAPRLPYGATLVIITGLTYPPMDETLWRLKQHGRKIVLVSFAQTLPPSIPGMLTVHQPFTD